MTTVRQAMTPHPPALDATVLYSGDNGRVFCGTLQCAGMSAYFGGRDISGKRVRKVKYSDIAGLHAYGLTFKCEGCGRNG